jgi:hypothetical protein
MKYAVAIAGILLSIFCSDKAFAGAMTPSRAALVASYVYVTPASGNTVSIASSDPQYIIGGGSTLSTLTVTLPACTAATDGRLQHISFEEAVTTLTVNTSGGSVVAAKPSSAASGSSFNFLCRGSDTTWHIG